MIVSATSLTRTRQEAAPAQLGRRDQCLAPRPSWQNELTCVNRACNLQGSSASKGQGDLTSGRLPQSLIS
jgi:hypothetical protein